MSRKTSKRDEELAGRIHSAAIHLLRRLRREDAGSGLNAPRLSALSVLVFAGEVTLGDLAAAEQVRPPTMTRMVDALAELGLVEKRPNAKDGRSTLIRATPAGKELMLAGRERRVRVLAAKIARLDPREREQLAAGTGILSRTIADM